MDDQQKYLDPLTLAKVRDLELRARLVVEGYLSGTHKSPYHGFSVEFAQHREYVPGDDLKHLDWKVFSRTGRFYLKQYEEETNLACWLLVDVSESMQYGSGPRGDDGRPLVSKYDYACMAACALVRPLPARARRDRPRPRAASSWFVARPRQEIPSAAPAARRYRPIPAALRSRCDRAAAARCGPRTMREGC